MSRCLTSPAGAYGTILRAEVKRKEHKLNIIESDRANTAPSADLGGSNPAVIYDRSGGFRSLRGLIRQREDKRSTTASESGRRTLRETWSGKRQHLQVLNSVLTLARKH